MAKRNQTVIKKFRGNKRAAKDATNDWMAGTSGDVGVDAKRRRKEPPFQVVRPLQDSKPAATVLKNKENESEAEDEGEVPPYDAMASDEEADSVPEAQMVTPSGQKRPPAMDKPTTVEQYQAMIKNYQAQLLRAERQVRAISKTNLADKFLENEVRKYVKESLWKRCKFITCRETMDECMNEVAAHFAIEGDKREHWKSTYENAVRDALNNRRNNSAQDLKKELIGMWNQVCYGNLKTLI